MDGESVRICGFSNRAWAEHAIGELRDLGLTAELDLADGDRVPYAVIVRGCEEKLRMLRSLADADESDQGCTSRVEGNPWGSTPVHVSASPASGPAPERMTPTSGTAPEHATSALASGTGPERMTPTSGTAPRFAWCDFVNSMDGLLPS